MGSLKSKIESLLFISAKPMSAKQLADVFKKSEEDVKKAGDKLVDIYKEDARGVQIVKSGSKYQMVSSPENASFVQEFIKDETTGELSRPSLETLTIIAYKAPVAKLDLDRIRGVNCSLILRNLLLRGLVEAHEDKEKGETIFNVSFDFLRFLGINKVSELPDYEKLHKDETIDQILDNISGDEKSKDKNTSVDSAPETRKEEMEGQINSSENNEEQKD